MLLVMTVEITLASKGSQVFEFQSPGAGVRKYYGSVKINEITIVRGIALAETEAVGIMAY